ncbi:MAG: D-alanyl-D-alanine carboxypeptidase family protein [Patescibacteria group bacterium]|jgi:D-alanyl-D-alanine carboxypeptidase (penicillin-binding protein 5/6)
MIIKSLIIASIILDLLGLDSLSHRFDRAIISEEYSPSQSAVASNISLSLPDILPRPIVSPTSSQPQILAKHYLLADADTDKIIIKQSPKERVPIASTTKIMTAVVVLENYDLDDVVTVSERAAYQIGADAFLRVGEQITVRSLLKALLIKSGNDSAYALAEHINSSGETGTGKFVGLMNQKAKELGLVDTDYRDPAGLDTTGYSSAFDLYLVTKHALKNPIFADIVKTEHAVVKDVDGSIFHELKNSNRLVGEYQYSGAIGVKTGYMPEAGHILVSAARRDGHTLVGVVVDTFADTAPASADESRKLLDWGFQNILWR